MNDPAVYEGPDGTVVSAVEFDGDPATLGEVDTFEVPDGDVRNGDFIILDGGDSRLIPRDEFLADYSLVG